MGNVDSSLLLLTYLKMTEDIIYTLKWKDFSPNVKSRVSDVIKEQSFCDVTLVSDDQKPFQAHRYVLSTFSPVLKDILLNNPHSHPLIYLRGVNHQELDSILQFIYLGKASVNHSNMKRFAQAAKDLQIKKLAENIRMGNPTESVDDLENKDDIPNKDIQKDNGDQTENEYAGRSNSDTPDEIINLDIPGSDKLWSGKQLYKCEECEASYKHKKHLRRHTSSKHEGICYSCKYCGFKATQQSSLKIHQEAIHEGVRYSCDQCDHYFTQQNNLKTHKKYVHEGVKYSCDQCDYYFAHQRSLKEHKKSVHEGVKYSCNQCEYQATQQRNLKNHKKSVHEGVKYFCDKCNYQAGAKKYIKRHKSQKH